MRVKANECLALVQFLIEDTLSLFVVSAAPGLYRETGFSCYNHIASKLSIGGEPWLPN